MSDVNWGNIYHFINIMALTFRRFCTSVNWVPCRSHSMPDRFSCSWWSCLPSYRKSQLKAVKTEMAMGLHPESPCSVGFSQEGLQKPNERTNNDVKYIWYTIYFIYTSHHFTPHERHELNKLASLPMCGFIAQLVEHRTGIAEVTGANPVEALIFSGFFFPIA